MYMTHSKKPHKKKRNIPKKQKYKRAARTPECSFKYAKGLQFIKRQWSFFCQQPLVFQFGNNLRQT